MCVGWWWWSVFSAPPPHQTVLTLGLAAESYTLTCLTSLLLSLSGTRRKIQFLSMIGCLDKEREKNQRRYFSKCGIKEIYLSFVAQS